ncbi:hypothetical protein CYMTET_36762, partial [Cymbomonas tetramitiformis]
LTGISPEGYRPLGMDDDLPGADAGGGKGPPGTKGGAALDSEEFVIGTDVAGGGRGKTVSDLGGMGDEPLIVIIGALAVRCAGSWQYIITKPDGGLRRWERKKGTARFLDNATKGEEFVALYFDVDDSCSEWKGFPYCGGRRNGIRPPSGSKLRADIELSDDIDTSDDVDISDDSDTGDGSDGSDTDWADCDDDTVIDDSKDDDDVPFDISHATLSGAADFDGMVKAGMSVIYTARGQKMIWVPVSWGQIDSTSIHFSAHRVYKGHRNSQEGRFTIGRPFF